MFSYAAISILPLRLLLVSCVVLMCTVTAIAQGPEAPSIRVVDDIPQQTQESVRITFTVKGASKKRIRVKVDCSVDAVTSKEIAFSNDGEHVVTVNLFKGTNTITLIGFVNDEPNASLTNPIQVTCKGKWCRSPFMMTSETVASELKESNPSGGDSPEPGGGASQGQKPLQPPAQKSGIQITSPAANSHYQNQLSIPVNISVDRKEDNAKNTKLVYITVTNQNKNVPQDNIPVEVSQFPSGDPKKLAEITAQLRLGKGKNSILVFDQERPDERALIDVFCDGPCGAASGNITIEKPVPSKFQDATFIESKIVVTKTPASEPKRVFLRVINNGKPVEQIENTLKVVYDGNTATLTPRIRIGPGLNSILVFDSDKDFDKAPQHSVDVTCDGKDCGVEGVVSNLATDSQTTRGIIGFEQAGASSASSETKPFVDFYFTAPLFYDRRTKEIPRVAAWGNIRLSTTPEQSATLAAFPSTLVNQVQTSNTVSLVQSFDFLAGLEGRMFTLNGSFLSLIPGVKQRTHFYLAFGGGAISPLSTTKQSAQIFKVPDQNSSQFELFKSRFPAAVNNQFIGFVLPERDRFLRQFYAGIRLKTSYCEDPECNRFINHFPAIVDVMVGQNEAVTGGSLKYDVFDSNGNKIDRKRSYVLRFDAFYPLPLKQLSFLYLYGTALLKIGAGGVKISTPLFLDQAPGDIIISNPNVFIAPTLQFDRDYYKIGMGINLIDLFNRPKTNQ